MKKPDKSERKNLTKANEKDLIKENGKEKIKTRFKRVSAPMCYRKTAI